MAKILGAQQFANVCDAKFLQMMHLKVNSGREKCEDILICDGDFIGVNIPAIITSKQTKLRDYAQHDISIVAGT